MTLTFKAVRQVNSGTGAIIQISATFDGALFDDGIKPLESNAVIAGALKSGSTIDLKTVYPCVTELVPLPYRTVTYKNGSVSVKKGTALTVVIAPGAFGEGVPTLPETVEENIAIPDPVREGYVLVGWTVKQDLTTLTLTALWAEDHCTVTFDSDGGSAVETQVVEYGKTVNRPDDPAKTGSLFQGWYLDDALWAFEAPVTQDMTLTAHWGTCAHTGLENEPLASTITAPTCVSNGQGTKICPACGDTVIVTIPATGIHTPGDWGESTATCTEPGTEVRRCSECGQVVETRTVAALGHTPGTDWRQDDDNHWHICTRCNEPVETAAHVYPDEWTVRTPATTTAEGEEYHNCTVCGHEVTQIIAMLPVTPVIPPVTPPVTPVTPPTVDPGTNIPDEEVPLANVSGLNDVDHFAYIAGYEDGTVRPTNNITRAEVATIFFRLMTEEYRVANWATSNTFTDANPSGWYNAAISTAAKAGILKGYTDGSVKPGAAITRAEFAAIAARFISDDVTDDGTGDFADTATHWAAKEIRLAAKAGWVKGDGNLFRPNDPITRAEVMAMVNRMLDRIPSVENMLPGMKTWSDNPAGTWYYADVQEATNDHVHKRAEDGVTEIWTELTEAKDWTALEAEWAANNGASAPKAETPSENEAA